MNWDAVGASAELVGAAAVVATLLYLSVQLRQNTKAVEAEIGRANLEQGTTWLYEVIRDPEVARLYLAGLADELESPEDKLRFHLLLQALFNQWAFMYTTDGGLVEPDVAHVLSTPGGRKYWQRANANGMHDKSWHDSRNFVEYVTGIERKLKQGD